MRFRSKKREALYRERRPLVALLLEEHPICQRCGTTPLPSIFSAWALLRPWPVTWPSGRPIIHSTKEGDSRGFPLGPMMVGLGAGRLRMDSQRWMAGAYLPQAVAVP